MTRNLNKKRPIAMEQKDIIRIQVSPNAVYFFFLNTPESCLSFIKEKRVQNQFKPMQKIHKTHHLLKKYAVY
jgi:hypothetical protein